MMKCFYVGVGMKVAVKCKVRMRNGALEIVEKAPIPYPRSFSFSVSLKTLNNE